MTHMPFDLINDEYENNILKNLIRRINEADTPEKKASVKRSFYIYLGRKNNG